MCVSCVVVVVVVVLVDDVALPCCCLVSLCVFVIALPLRFVFSTWWRDMLFYIRNDNSLLGICCVHPNNPYRPALRTFTFAATFVFACALSSYFALLLDCSMCTTTAPTCEQCTVVNAARVYSFQPLPRGIPLPDTLSNDPLSGFLSSYTDDPKLWLINLRLLMRSFPGGCRWCATKYRIETNGSTVPFLPVDRPTPDDQHGSGCVDAVTFYIFRFIARKNAPACDIDDALQGQNPWGAYMMASSSSLSAFPAALLSRCFCTRVHC